MNTFGAQMVLVINPGVTVTTESPLHFVAAGGGNSELREDATYILREDGFKVTRE